VVGTTTSLSVLGSDPAGQANLIYTWSAISLPTGAAAPIFSVNGSNAAQDTVATFSTAGNYTLQASITDPAGLSVLSTVALTVDQTLTSIIVSPPTPNVVLGQSQPFTALALDQFGNALAVQPSFTWLTTGASNSITPGGVFTAGAVTGPVTISAAAAAVTGSTTGDVLTSSAVPTIADAGFESPSVGNGYLYNPTGTGWVFTPGTPFGSGIAGNVSAFTAGNPAAPQGTQVAFLQETSSISQTVSGWQAGNYVLTFSAAQRQNYQHGGQNFDVLVDNVIVGSFTPSSTNYATYTTSPFTVTPGAHTITFQGLDTVGGDNTAFIDNVQVQVAAAAIPIIADAGFESPAVGNGYIYDPTGTGWIFTPGTPYGSGIAGNDSAFTAGNPSAPQGTQVAFLQETSTISQTISNGLSGSYVLCFSAAQRQNYQHGGQNFQVLLDNIVIGTFTPTSTAYATYTTNPFTVPAGNHTITFQGLDSIGGDNTAFIDNVQIVPA
jgi:ligand-binding SRPBCC domain-containing protein